MEGEARVRERDLVLPALLVVIGHGVEHSEVHLAEAIAEDQDPGRVPTFEQLPAVRSNRFGKRARVLRIQDRSSPLSNDAECFLERGGVDPSGLRPGVDPNGVGRVLDQLPGFAEIPLEDPESLAKRFSLGLPFTPKVARQGVPMVRLVMVEQQKSE